MENEMQNTLQEKNKALVLEAFDMLINRRDYVAAERYWSPHYIQHGAHIPPGRDGLFNLIKGIPSTLKYEPGVIVADGNFVIVHRRFSGHGRLANWIEADKAEEYVVLFLLGRPRNRGKNNSTNRVSLSRNKFRYSCWPDHRSVVGNNKKRGRKSRKKAHAGRGHEINWKCQFISQIVMNSL